MGIDQDTTFLQTLIDTEVLCIPPFQFIIFRTTNIDYNVSSLEIDALSGTSS